MTTVHVQLVGDRAVLSQDAFECLVQLARQSDRIELEVARKTTDPLRLSSDWRRQVGHVTDGPTDYTVDATHPEFPLTGRHVTLVLRLQKWGAVEHSLIARRLGRVGLC